MLRWFKHMEKKKMVYMKEDRENVNESDEEVDEDTKRDMEGP